MALNELANQVSELPDESHWEAQAEEEHSYVMLCFAIRQSYFRRQRELGRLPDWDYLDETWKAQAVFEVRYDVARSACLIVRERLSLDDLNAPDMIEKQGN